MIDIINTNINRSQVTSKRFIITYGPAAGSFLIQLN